MLNQSEVRIVARILVISGTREEGRSLARLLRRDGHRTELATSDAAAARSLAPRPPELIVLSLPDPAAALVRLARHLRAELRRTPAVAIVREDADAIGERDLPGLMDLLPTPFTDESFLARVDALLRVRDVLHGGSHGARPEDADALGGDGPADAGLLRRMLLRLDRALHVSVRRNRRPLEPYLETAAAIAGAVDRRDSLEAGHALRVSNHCASIAAFLGMGREATEQLLYAASVHDIGKITISAELLAKPSLNDADRRLMRLHARRGAELIRALTRNEEAAELVLNHHERPDGKGYHGRTLEEIPLAARVLSVAEAFDGMTSCRASGPPLSPEEAIERLRAGSGTAYDTECVQALAAAVRPRRRSIPLSPFTSPTGN